MKAQAPENRGLPFPINGSASPSSCSRRRPSLRAPPLPARPPSLRAAPPCARRPAGRRPQHEAPPSTPSPPTTAPSPTAPSPSPLLLLHGQIHAGVPRHLRRRAASPSYDGSPGEDATSSVRRTASPSYCKSSRCRPSSSPRSAISRRRPTLSAPQRCARSSTRSSDAHLHGASRCFTTIIHRRHL